MEEYTPWYKYINKLDRLFADDEDVEVGNYSVTDSIVRIEIICHDITRFQALKEVLSNCMMVGDKRIFLEFKYEGNPSDDYCETFKKAFSGNPYFKEIVRNDEHKEFVYAVFKKDVISYFSDKMN